MSIFWMTSPPPLVFTETDEFQYNVSTEGDILMSLSYVYEHSYNVLQYL